MIILALCCHCFYHGYDPDNSLIGFDCCRGGVTPLNKPYRYVLPQRVWFLGLFGLKTGIHFAHFGLESGMVFEVELQECVNVFIVSISDE